MSSRDLSNLFLLECDEEFIEYALRTNCDLERKDFSTLSFNRSPETSQMIEEAKRSYELHKSAKRAMDAYLEIKRQEEAQAERDKRFGFLNKNSIFPSYDFNPPSYTLPYQNEDPETVIARQNPELAAELRNRIAEREQYDENMQKGVEAAEDYINRLSPEEAARITGFRIYPNATRRLFGVFPIGKMIKIVFDTD